MFSLSISISHSLIHSFSPLYLLQLEVVSDLEARIEEMTREIETLSQAHSSLAQDKVRYDHYGVKHHIHTYCNGTHILLGGARTECLFIRDSTNPGTAQVLGWILGGTKSVNCLRMM